MTAKFISKNKVIYLKLLVFDENGLELESNEDGDAFTYIHGQGIIMPKLEEALDGKKIGDEIKVTLSPDDAYGPYLEEAVVRIPKNQLSEKVDLTIGNGVNVEGPNGLIELYIKSYDNENVELDANHPYAGKTLTFHAEILAIRDAHHDEIWHRRVHPGGHHLMVKDSSFAGD